jgi:hypothetical protein
MHSDVRASGAVSSTSSAFHRILTACKRVRDLGSLNTEMLRRFSIWLRDTSTGTPSNTRSLLVQEEGAVFVEYLTLTLLVAVVCAAATLTMGDQLLRRYKMQQAVIVMPIP